MMKTDIDNMILEQERQILSDEELVFDWPITQTNTETEQEELELERIAQNSDALLAIITEQAKYKRIWQIVSACLIIVVVVISLLYLALYNERENYIEKLSMQQTNLHKATNDLTQINQKAGTLEEQLSKSNKEIKRIENELTGYKTQLKAAQDNLINSKSEVEKLRSQLSETNQQLKELQSRNIEAVKRLNERLQTLSKPNE